MLKPLQEYLLTKQSQTYSAYYNGKMSYTLHGKEWEKYVAKAFSDLSKMQTSENIFKTVIDLYAENLVPSPLELNGFRNLLIPLLCRGQAPAVVSADGVASFPEHYEMVSDGDFTAAAIFTRSLSQMTDFVTFAYSDGHADLYAKDVPSDLSVSDRLGYKFVETTYGNHLFRFALDDKGFGGVLSALQDRINHSILDQTIIAEMYVRPFWYLLNVQLPPVNPYLPKDQIPSNDLMKEQPTTADSGRVFTTSSEGPFGQLEPPTLTDIITYHDGLVEKVSQSTGIPMHYFRPGVGTPPTGIALKTLSKRFNNRISRMRSSITPQVRGLATVLGVAQDTSLWTTDDDLLQESRDAHGLALFQMGYPLGYIASVVTPEADLSSFLDDGYDEAHRDGLV